MSVKDVKLYICDACNKQILTPRNGLHLCLEGAASWVGGFSDQGGPAKGEMPTLKPRTPGKDTDPFKGIGASSRGTTVTLCRKCLADKLGFAPDPETPEEDDPKKPKPTDRFGHDDPL